MSMIDEEVLREVMRLAAESVEVAPESARAVVTAARELADESPTRRFTSARRTAGRARLPLVAAAAMVAVTAISLPLVRSEGRARVSAAQKLVHSAPSDTFSGSGFEPASGGSVPYAPTSAQGLVVTATATTKGGSVAARIESSGSVDLRVRDGGVEATFARLGATARADGGSVLSTQAQVGSRPTGHFAYGTIVLQVPQHAFATLVGQVQRVGHATSINTSSSDVTSQYVDLRARISSQEASRRQYLAIMTRASSIDGILAVQRQLDSIQSSIEQLQGQLNVLDHQTTYGSLTVFVTTAANRSAAPRHRSGVAAAFHDAIGGFVTGFEWSIRLAGPILFTLLAVGVVWALGWLVRRRIRHRRV